MARWFNAVLVSRWSKGRGFGPLGWSGGRMFFFSFQSQVFVLTLGFLLLLLLFILLFLFFIRCTPVLAQKHVKDRTKNVGVQVTAKHKIYGRTYRGWGWGWVPRVPDPPPPHRHSAPRSGAAINPLRVNLNICLKKLVVCIDQEQDYLPTQMDPAGRGLTNVLVF